MITTVLQRLSYKDWQFHLGSDRGHHWLQVRFHASDPTTFKPYDVHGRKWLISQHATDSEIVLTALKAVLTAEEHEAREQFRYNGRAVFNPHIDIDALASVCDQVDVR